MSGHPGVVEMDRSPQAEERRRAVAIARDVLQASGSHNDSNMVIIARQLLRALGLPERA